MLRLDIRADMKTAVCPRWGNRKGIQAVQCPALTKEESLLGHLV